MWYVTYTVKTTSMERNKVFDIDIDILAYQISMG